MRSDMAKVIVERPRYGSRLPTKGKGYLRKFAGCAWDEQPKRERMKLRGGGMKTFNEHLSPLRRYLAKQVGRPWAKVFAEICDHINRDSVVQDHVRDHVEDYVETKVIVQDGRLCYGAGWRYGQPLSSMFYVCPRTGTLRENPQRHGWKRGRRVTLRLLALEGDWFLVRHNGVWRAVRVQGIPVRDGARGSIGC